MRRLCPFESDCPYRREWRLSPLKHHEHVWTFPQAPLVMALTYDRALFAEHAGEGLEQRVPRDWEEMIRWAKILTNPQRNEFGLGVELKLPAWHFLAFL